MASYRAERLAELIHREVAQRLRVEVKDPRIGDVSITGVEVSRDLQHARVHFLPLGGGEPSADLVEGLASAGRALRGPIGRALRLRRAPELAFSYDRQFERAVAVTDLLRGLRPAADEPAEAPDVDEGDVE